MRNRIGSLLLFLAALAVGCSDDDDASDFGPRFCALFKPCCDKAGLPGDQSTCRMLYGSARPTSKSLAEQCLTEYEALANDPTFCDFSHDEPESCQKAFPDGSGGKKPGETCDNGSDCAGDSTCDHDFDRSPTRGLARQSWPPRSFRSGRETRKKPSPSLTP